MKTTISQRLEFFSTEERALQYRKLAKEAYELANASRIIDIRRDYLRIAANWHALAEELERIQVPTDRRPALFSG